MTKELKEDDNATKILIDIFDSIFLPMGWSKYSGRCCGPTIYEEKDSDKLHLNVGEGK